MIYELQDVLANIKTLCGMLHICMSCRKVRDDEGNWEEVEVYVRNLSQVQFTHGLYPDCSVKMEKEVAELNKNGRETG